MNNHHPPGDAGDSTPAEGESINEDNAQMFSERDLLTALFRSTRRLEKSAAARDQQLAVMENRLTIIERVMYSIGGAFALSFIAGVLALVIRH